MTFILFEVNTPITVVRQEIKAESSAPPLPAYLKLKTI